MRATRQQKRIESYDKARRIHGSLVLLFGFRKTKAGGSIGGAVEHSHRSDSLPQRGRGTAIAVDEESIFICTRGNLLIRHSQARATFPAGEG